jgi:hypothetical protein
MDDPLAELKTRARLKLNAAGGRQPDLRLRDCLHAVARDVGFAHWEHARRVLGGSADPGEDMGTFWHAPGCSSLLSLWFSDLVQARAALDSRPANVLLPFKRQFLVVDESFIVELGLAPDSTAWAQAQRDLVKAYADDAWRTLAMLRMRSPRHTFA